jgi:gamma-glutamylcyclotransferase (GGCT)/AIG2-like uncharacterized protein YtfP
MMKQNLFVYGTLKSGECNNLFLRDQDFLGEAVSVKKFLLEDCGVPCLCPYDCARNRRVQRKAGYIKGELWSVGRVAMRPIDRLEGNYVPLISRFRLESGVVKTALVYTMMNWNLTDDDGCQTPDENGILEWSWRRR